MTTENTILDKSILCRLQDLPFVDAQSLLNNQILPVESENFSTTIRSSQVVSALGMSNWGDWRLPSVYVIEITKKWESHKIDLHKNPPEVFQINDTSYIAYGRGRRLIALAKFFNVVQIPVTLRKLV